MAAAPLQVLIVLFEGVEELDFVGPWEVLTMAKAFGHPIEPRLVAKDMDPITCAKGMRVLPDTDFASAPDAGILCVPGGQGTRRGVRDAVLIDFIARTGMSAEWIASVCTGAALVGKAGLADNKRLTTHWQAMDFVRAFLHEATLATDERVVIDGNLISAAGVSAGIDMALALVGKLYGEPAALDVQRAMEYYPEPPFGSVHPVKGA